MTIFDQDDPDPARRPAADVKASRAQAAPAPSPAPAGPAVPLPTSGSPPGTGPPPATSPKPGREKRRRIRRRAPDDGEYVEIKPDTGPWRKLIAILLVFGVVIGAMVGGSYWWYRRQVNPPGPPGKAISIVIQSGTSTSGIADELEKGGVIGNKTVFTFYVRRKNAGPFEAGRFVLRKNSDFDSVIGELERGPIPPAFTRVNIPEGLTVRQIAARLHSGVARFFPSKVLEALASGAIRSSLRQGPKGSWEGLLFPATYDVGVKADLPSVLSQMASKTEQVARAEGIDQGSFAIARRYGIRLSPYQTLIVASLIQREAGNPQEAPKIAAVIYNRLRQKVPLGIDATSLFLANVTGKKIDFSSPSAYNTRRQRGLPPTPIATPSRASLHAALHPASGPWLYYVLTSRGKHTFAVTPAQFIAAKRICAARGLGCG